MNKGNLRINRDAIRALHPAAGDNILEIGMGNGAFVKEITSVDASVKYTGCDYSELMVKEAEKINSDDITNSRASFYHSVADTLPFPDSSFNKIITVNTIYFWDDTHKTLEELKRVLKPKGKIFIVVRPKRQMTQFAFVKYGFTPYSKEELIALIHTNGLTVIDTIENPEPDSDLNGTLYKMENLIVIAQKNQ